MFGLGAGELLIICVFALIFIGPKKLPELAKSLGKGLREFQNAKDDFMNTVNSEVNQYSVDEKESEVLATVSNESDAEVDGEAELEHAQDEKDQEETGKITKE